MKESSVSASTSKDLDALSEKLAGSTGKDYWQNLEEASQDPAFVDYLAKEFPSQRFRWQGDGASRRDFLRLMGASLAVGGLGACTRQPDEMIVPFSAQPESRIPGKPQFFATSMPLGGDTLGLVVESHSGRPTKIDQNPGHPSGSAGTTNLAQATILDLYDPDRSRMPIKGGRPSSWDRFVEDYGLASAGPRSRAGEGMAILSQEVLSPSQQRQLDGLKARYPALRTYRWQPLNRDNSRRGAEMAFGQDVACHYDLSKADVVASFDANFLDCGPGRLRLAKDFAQRRRVRAGTKSMNRLYVVESTATMTGAAADHRWGRKSAQVEELLHALGAQLGIAGAQAGTVSAEDRKVVEAMAKDLQARSGNCVVMAGESLPAGAHALAHAINAKLGSVGKAVKYSRPVEEAPAEGTLPTMSESITALVADLDSGAVGCLMILGGNPVYDAPAGLDFGSALRKADFAAHLSIQENETSRFCHWHLPESHYLESWGDSRSADGTLSLIQPLIAPLYDSRSATEFLAIVEGRAGSSAHEIVRESVRKDWEAAGGTGDFEKGWLTSLHAGFVADTAFPELSVSPAASVDYGRPSAPAGTEIALRSDPCLWDGRFANNGWLQELPRPIYLVTWDNCAYVAPATAEKNGWKRGEVVEITAQGRSVKAPVWLVPGQPEDVITLHFGGGRRASGRVGNGVGFDAYALRGSGDTWTVGGAKVASTGDEVTIAGVQEHFETEGRDLVREARFPADSAELNDVLSHLDPHGHHAGDHGDDHDHEGEGAQVRHVAFADASLYESRVESDGGEYQWGMSIDLSSCLGCNACTISCQAENNIPVVGRDEVASGRELHWLRIDRYYVGDLSDPKVRFQPVACQHCEKAPCEVVCPVGATTHSPEGINEMTYNRCVGTRYCSNNCPYKVRRFNFFRYADFSTESLKLGRNPDVTVRSRGVMEKCTYCVQRVNQARIASKVEGRRIRDGEIQTACQTACPAGCIEFGDVSDETTRVSQAKREAHSYSLLEEVGTVPRTTYLAKLTNPNPELAPVS